MSASDDRTHPAEAVRNALQEERAKEREAEVVDMAEQTERLESTIERAKEKPPQ